MKKLALLCFVSAFLALMAPSARAVFTFMLSQVGNNVVVNGSGTLNITALTLQGTSTGSARIQPLAAILTAGPATTGTYSYYTGSSFTGPTNFGAGDFLAASAGTGDRVAIQGFGAYLFVPPGYVSGTALSNTATFANQTLASLGFTPGTYTFAWGSGANIDSVVVTSIVPEPSTWVLLGLGAVGAGVVALRRRQARA